MGWVPRASARHVESIGWGTGAGPVAYHREVDDRALRDELLRYETALATRSADGLEGGLTSLLADDFLEFGRSGRVWTRESVEVLLTERPTGPIGIDGFELARLGDDVALVTYRAAGANRSSIWVRRAGRWQIRFHQGTPVRG